jgi:hypothetical protein
MIRELKANECQVRVQVPANLPTRPTWLPRPPWVAWHSRMASNSELVEVLGSFPRAPVIHPSLQSKSLKRPG